MHLIISTVVYLALLVTVLIRLLILHILRHADVTCTRQHPTPLYWLKDRHPHTAVWYQQQESNKQKTLKVVSYYHRIDVGQFNHS